jgi:uncharacterized protein YfdQ (DUF2303 family)
MSDVVTPDPEDIGEPIYRGDYQAMIDAVRQTNAPAVLDPEAAQIVIVPAGSVAFQPDLSAWRAHPSRRTGEYRPSTVEAFAAVGKLYADDATTVWVHPTSGEVVAVFDDNAGKDPGWRKHSAKLQLQKTPEWLYWTAKDNTMMSQGDFAEHIEGGLEEIARPDAADVLEMAQSFHASHEASFRSQQRLASGEVQFLYDETIKATAGATGQLTVPTTILLTIAPFIAEAREQITARLRFRLSGGKLTLGYILDRPDSVLQAALEGVAERLGKDFPRVFVGSPA